MANQIKFNIGFNVDKAGLNDLKASLYSIQNMTPKDIIGASNVADAKAKLKQVQDAAKLVQEALASSFNPKLNTYSIDNFNKHLSSSGVTLRQLRTDFAQAGAKGEAAFRQLATSISSTKLPLRESHDLLKSMGVTLMNTIKWSIASNAINGLTGSIQKAWSFTKELDSSLNDIMIVTGKSSDEMAKFARQANKAAKELKTSTNQYAQAALIYYQQGLSNDEVAARSDVTVKAANVTRQSAQTVSEQLTAIWNGYKVSAQEAELYIDKVAAVAASTAADLKELSVGMSRVASAANIMGVDIDQLNAQLATIVSVTREAPESVGTALKTVYARMSDIRAGLDSETTLDEYTKQMAQMGINVLDAQGNLRDMGDVVEEIGNKWNTLNRNQQVSLAQTIAGTRQYSRMMALFDNWNIYNDALITSQNSLGTLQQQQDTYAESLEAHLAEIQAETEDLYLSIFDAESFKDILKILTTILDGVGQFVDSIGGGGALLGALVPILTRMFSGSIANGMATFVTNWKAARTEAQLLKDTLNSVNNLKTAGLTNYDQNINNLRGNLVKLRQQGVLTIEEFNELQTSIDEYSKAVSQAALATEQATKTSKGKAEKLQKNFGFGENKAFSEYFNYAAQQGQTFASQGVSKIAAVETLQGARWYQDATGAFDAIQTKIDQLTKETAEWNKELQKTKEGLTSLESFNKQFDSISSQAAQLKDSSIISGKEKGAITQREGWIRKAQARAQKEIEATGKVSDKTMKKLQDHIAKYEELIRTAGKSTSSVLKQSQQQFEQLATGEIASAENEVQALGDAIDQKLSKANLEQSIQQFTQMTSSIMMINSAINILHGLGDIWSNEDLTTGQKLYQTFTNLTMALSMIIPSLVTMAGIISANTKAKMAEAAATLVNVRAQKAEKDAAAESAFYKKILEECSDELGDELSEEARQHILNGEAIEKETKELLKNAAAKKIANKGSVGDMSLDKAGMKEAKDLLKDQNGGLLKNGFKNISSWFKENWKGLAKGAGAAVGIAAAVAGVTWIVKSVKTLVNAEEDAAGAAASASAQATARAQELQQQYQSVLDTLSNYDSASDAIDDMVEGTQQWRDAVAETNNQVMALMKLYPELADEVKTVNGRMIFSDKGKEIAEQKASSQASLARALSYGTSSYNLRAQNEALAEKASENKIVDAQGSEDNGNDNSFWKGAGKGAMVGAGVALAASMLLGPIGWVAAAAITVGGAIIGGAVEAAADIEDEREEADKTLAKHVADAYSVNSAIFSSKEEFSKALKVYSDVTDEEIDALWANKEEVENLAKEMAANNKLLKVQEAQAAGEYISSLGIAAYDNSIYKDAVNTIFGAEASQIAEQKLKEVQDADDTDIAKEYAKLYGYDWVSSKDGVTKLSKTDAQGNVQQFEINQTDMESAVATARGYAEVLGGESKEDLFEVLRIAEKAGTSSNANINRQLVNLLAGAEQAIDLGSLTKSQFAELQNMIANSNLTSAELARLGFDQGTVLNYLDKTTSDWNKVLDEVDNSAAKTALGKIFTDNGLWIDVTLNGQKKFAQTFNKIFDTYGTENGKAILAGLENLGTSYDDFANYMSQHDLTSLSGIKEFEKQVRGNSELFNKIGDDALRNVVQSIYVVEGAYKEWTQDASQVEYSSLQKIRSSLKEIGDTISEDDFKALAPELQSYFVQLADGTYALSGAANEFAFASEQSYQSWLKVTAAAYQAELNSQLASSTDDNEFSLESASQYRATIDQLIKSAATEAERAMYAKQYNDWYTANQASITAAGAGESLFGFSSNYLAQLNAATLTEFDDGIDTLKKYDTQLQLVENDLSKLKNIQDTLVGDDLLDNIKMQNNLLADQVAIINKRIEAAKKEAKEADKNAAGSFSEIASIYNSLDESTKAKLGGYEQFLTKDGTIDYNKYQELLLWIDSLIESTAAGSGTRDSLEKLFGSLKTDVESVVSFEVDVIPGLEADAAEKTKEILDNNFAIYETKIELAANVQELKKDFNNFMRELGEEDDYALQANTYATDLVYNLQEAENLATRYNELQTLRAQGLITETQYIEAAGKLNEDIQNNLLEKKEIEQQIEETLLTTLEERNDAYAEYIGQLQTATDILEQHRSIYTSLYGEDAYEEMKNIYAQQVSFGQQALSTQTQLLQGLYADLANVEEGSEKYLLLVQQISEGTSEWYNLLQSQIENLTNQLTNEINAVFQEYENNLTGGMKLDSAKEDWDWVVSQSKKYYDNIDAAYQIRKMESAFNKAINNTTSITAQQKLNKAKQQELDILKSKQYLTEYDIKRAEYNLKITEAEIALQDAQAEKSKMRLTRDLQGNYSYQYIADADLIEEKQQELLDLNNQLYNLDKEEYISNLNDFYDAYDQWRQKMLEAYADGNVTEEERKELERLEAEIDRLAQKTVGEDGALSNLLNSSETLASKFGTEANGIIEAASQGMTTMAQTIADEGFGMISTQVKEEISTVTSTLATELESLRNQINASVDPNGEGNWLYNLTELIKNLTDEDGSLTTNLDKLNTAADDIIEVNDSMKTLSGTYETLAQDLVTYANNLVNALAEAKGITDMLVVVDNYDALTQITGEEGKQYYDKSTGKSYEWDKEANQGKGGFVEYGTIAAKGAIANAATEKDNYYTPIITEKDRIIANQAAQILTLTGNVEPPPQENKYSITTFTGTRVSTNKDSIQENDIVKMPQIASHYTMKGDKSGFNKTAQKIKVKNYEQKEFAINSISDKTGPNGEKIAQIYHVNRTSNGFEKVAHGEGYYVALNELLRDEYIQKLNTGGYTGEWDSSGRLAVLHQKELVLNATDTQKILDAVSLVRSFENSINSALSDRYMEQLALMSARLDFNNLDTQETNIEQTVHITAEFPNVSVKEEIEAAFEDIIDLAAQYAMENKK